MKAVDHVLGNVNFKKFDFNEYERNLIINSDLYNNIYNTTKEYWVEHCNLHDPNIQSLEQRSLNGKQNKNRKYIMKDGIYKSVHKDELEYYLSNGWIIESNNKNVHTGRKHMWKDNIQLFVKPEDFEKRLAEGYIFGDKPGSNSHKDRPKFPKGGIP